MVLSEKVEGKKKSIIIIGGGVGGLTLGAKLAKKGHKVTIYEKNGYCGGRCSQISINGFKWEQGAILYLFDSIYKYCFQQLDVKMEDYVQMVDPLEVNNHQIIFADGTKFLYTKNDSEFCKNLYELEKLESNNMAQLEPQATMSSRWYPDVPVFKPVFVSNVNKDEESKPNGKSEKVDLDSISDSKLVDSAWETEIDRIPNDKSEIESEQIDKVSNLEKNRTHVSEPDAEFKERFYKFLSQSEKYEKFVDKYAFNKTYDGWFYLDLLRLLFSVLFNLELSILWSALSSMYDCARRFFKSDKACQVLTFQALYFGVSPFSRTALFSMLTGYEIRSGMSYPKGGLVSIVNALEKIATEKGVEIIKNANVDEIMIGQKRKAIGVKLADGSKKHSDIVVANADLVYTYNHLLPKTKRCEYLVEKDHIPSTFTFFWGLSRRFDKLKSHNIFLPKQYKKLFEQIHVEKKIPDEPSFFIHIANRMDDVLAPKGKDALAVIVPIGEMADKYTDFDHKIKVVKKFIVKRLEKYLEITNFEDYIECEQIESPNSWMEKYNSWKGSILGINHSLNNLLVFRSQQKCSDFENLYYVGASVQTTAGVPIVMKSACLLADKIDKD